MSWGESVQAATVDELAVWAPGDGVPVEQFELARGAALAIAGGMEGEHFAVSLAGSVDGHAAVHVHVAQVPLEAVEAYRRSLESSADAV